MTQDSSEPSHQKSLHAAAFTFQLTPEPAPAREAADPMAAEPPALDASADDALGGAFSEAATRTPPPTRATVEAKRAPAAAVPAADPLAQTLASSMTPNDS